jgi:hypothetical protein
MSKEMGSHLLREREKSLLCNNLTSSVRYANIRSMEMAEKVENVLGDISLL